MAPVQIDASAPTRIDLAGGTPDIWPLYLFHEGTRTLGRHVADEWDNRKRLAPGVTTPEIDTMMDAAREAGAHGGKVCGAGGGCLVCIGDPSVIPAIRRALASAGARVLDLRVEREALQIETRDTAVAR
jgi:galactokinase/mevalonate kinase-like predicted kinase